jgi:hypothetical protein
MPNRLFWTLALLLISTFPACLVFQSSTQSIDPRQEYCETIIDYCLLYPDTLQRVAVLEEEHGVQLSMPGLDSEIWVKGFRNYVYQDLQDWYETEVRSKEAAYEAVDVKEANYTDDFLRLHMELDRRLHLVQVHRLDRERWVVVRWDATQDTRRPAAIKLFDRIDVIPGQVR